MAPNLSSSLLACKDAPPATTPTQDLDTMRRDAKGKARIRPVLVWSTQVKNEAEPNTDEDTSDAVHRATAAPRATALAPVIRIAAEKAIQHLYDNLRDRLRAKDHERAN